MNDSINPTKTMSGSLSAPHSIFVTINGDIYIDNDHIHGRVDKFTLNSNISIPVMHVSSLCFGLFVDMNNTLYCSMYHHHKVVKKWLNDNSNITSVAAGTGVNGSTSNMLYHPAGIFVDINFDLYVADQYNDRIQLFRSGELDGITIAGEGSLTATITLQYPTGIVLDADKNLFIVDAGNNRIVRSGPHGFICLVGCSGSSGSASNQLYFPRSISFDNDANIFVADHNNHRIQKFLLATNSCGKYILRNDLIRYIQN